MRIVVGLVFGVILLIALGWRFASRRRSIPCPPWLGWLVERNNPFVESHNARFIVRNLDLQAGMKAVDIGCGPGRLTLPLAEQVGPSSEVVAMDIQPKMLRRAQAKAQAAGLTNIRFLQAGIGEGKLEPNTYDRAVLVTVLGEIPDRERAMQEIYEALKPGGILSVTEIIFDPHFQRRCTVLRLAGSAGFQQVSCTGSRFAYTMTLRKPLTAEHSVDTAL